MSSKDLKGKFALVTGGTRGIGAAIASSLLDQGAKVMVTGTRVGVTSLDRCSYDAVDFSELEPTQKFARKVSKMGLDILVNNAGINKITPFTEIKLADFEKIHAVNVRAPFLLCQAVLPMMRERKWGRIVNISSVFGVVSKALRASYSASKFALDGLTAALAAEVARDGILVNCVSPGFIDTELTRSILGGRGIAELVPSIPIGHLGKPEEIARFVTWLVSPENTYMSGQNIVIDGGFTRT